MVTSTVDIIIICILRFSWAVVIKSVLNATRSVVPYQACDSTSRQTDFRVTRIKEKSTQGLMHGPV